MKKHIVHLYRSPIHDIKPWKVVLDECTFGTTVETFTYRTLEEALLRIEYYKNSYNCTVAEHTFFPFYYLR